jgi:Calcineurin-like phosphoesterase
MEEKAMSQKKTRNIGHPVFAQPEPTADPTLFKVQHPSDDPAYKVIDELNKEHKIVPLAFPAPRGGQEPTLTLEQVFGGKSEAIDRITSSGQIVFHATGDCGSVRGPATQNEVSDKMVSDFDEARSQERPQFNFLLGDIVYSFGEAQYYYDQFYDPYRDYPAPILAVAGNHDGVVSPLAHAKSLDAFLRNFCAPSFTVTNDAGGLSRTAQIQPGVFFTFEAPFVRIIALYSNTLEDPGVIADGGPYKGIGKAQLAYLEAALTRVKKEKFEGALLFASHHPAYTLSRHGWSTLMTSQIDAICESVGVWPTAVLAGHAHNYQRFTRHRPDGTQIPYIVCGNGGHNVQRLSKGNPPRAPQVIQNATAGVDEVTFDSYDDTDFGYLRIIVTEAQVRIEYHPASDGSNAKTPDDHVTVDLKSRTLGHFVVNDLGWPAAAEAVRSAGASATQRRQQNG